VPCETGFDIVPNLTFEDCPSNPTLLLVPGGTSGTLNAIEDPETRNFLKRIGGGAAMVGSVCTGSLLLGATDTRQQASGRLWNYSLSSEQSPSIKELSSIATGSPVPASRPDWISHWHLCAITVAISMPKACSCCLSMIPNLLFQEAGIIELPIRRL